MISKVYLRKKKISKGKVSLYLDFYPPILIPGTNRTTRRYFLNVHLPEKPKSFAEREHVKSIMQKMEIFRLRVLEQIINEKFDFYDKIVEKTDFLDYFMTFKLLTTSTGQKMGKTNTIRSGFMCISTLLPSPTTNVLLQISMWLSARDSVPIC